MTPTADGKSPLTDDVATLRYTTMRDSTTLCSTR